VRAEHHHARASSARPSQLRRSLSACTAEGVVAEFAAACCGVGVLTAWALHLGAARWMVGLLGALPFVAQLLQVPAAYISARFGLRRVAIVTISTSRVVYLALAALPILPIGTSGRVGLLAAVAGSAAVLGAIGGNAWGSWMGELVPSSVRGRYFGRRTAFCTAGGAVASLLAGAVLDASQRAGRADRSLGVLAAVISVAGVACALLMTRMHKPKLRGAPPAMRWADAAIPLADPRGRRAIAYQAAWGGATGLASGFYALYMVEELHLGFFGATLHAAAFALARTFAAPLWGRAVDRIGARPVLILASLGLGLTSTIWAVVTPSIVWLLGVDALTSGALDAGQLLGGMALPLRIAPRDARPFYLAAIAMAGGLAFAAAAACGGALITVLPSSFSLLGRSTSSYGLLFLSAAALRTLASLLAVRLVEPGARSLPELGAAVLASIARTRDEPRVAREIAG
jgi:MFS family permease